jgi:hypothetical protein
MTATTPEQPLIAGAGAAADNNTGGQSRERAKQHPTRQEFTAWLIASCERQGIPVTVTDPSTLAAIATLLR